MNLPRIDLPSHLGKQLARGHPWIYRTQIERAPRLSSGTWVRVRCAKFKAYGLWDANGAIAVRLFSQNGLPDRRWVRERIAQAWSLRKSIRHSKTTAYRWLYGEGDGLPGVVVDLYGDYAVIQIYTASLQKYIPWVVDGLKKCRQLKGILLRDRHTSQIQTLEGRAPDHTLVVTENGLKIGVDLFSGQKTGLFCDHRDNRRYLESWCAEKKVLDCFSYTGAFALYALRGGAAEVLSADIAPQAAESARHNVQLNGFDPDSYHFVVTDCFDLLSHYAQEGIQFDLVILDPPSLAHAKKSRYAAIRAYTRLNQAAMRCVRPGGILATASCTSQVSPQAFCEMLGEASARAERRLLILHNAGHALDHPVLAQFPEGRYLKFILGRVQELS